ncbi:hypothetical protein [Sphingobacterium suaedae]|uniref:Uncharacterized protein n=1 Tax=Sphingobacterium suaedae TaxID=1686402 RepID=A0ABW5KGD5_9SPHI
MTLEERLQLYNKYYGFEENPDHFGFNFDPKRITIRNEALRTRNKELYETYLRERYPEDADVELEKFDEVHANIRKVSGEEAQIFFKRHMINNVQSDINPRDPDAIFTPSIVAGEEEMDAGQEDEGHILFNWMPEWLADRDEVWVDPTDIKMSMWQKPEHRKG